MMDIINPDFTKTFDTVQDAVLINWRNYRWWICNGSYNSKCRIIINGSLSEWQVVSSGVPEWSAFSPILLNFFISDLDVVRRVCWLNLGMTQDWEGYQTLWRIALKLK